MIYTLTAVHNRLEATKEFLRCLGNQTYKNFQLIVVDDGSTDGTASYIQKNYSKTIILSGDGNLWWTGALNLGITKILTTVKDNDFIFIGNSDMVFENNYLALLYETSQQNNRAIVGSVCKDYLNRNKILHTAVKINPKNLSMAEVKIGESFDTFSTRGVLVPIEVFKKIGLFDQKNFPHYVSDYDFFYRAKKAGFQLVLSDKAVVYNRSDLTGFRPNKKYLTLPEIYYKLTNIRSPGNLFNEIRFIWKHSHRLDQKIINSLRYLFATGLWLARQLFKL